MKWTSSQIASATKDFFKEVDKNNGNAPVGSLEPQEGGPEPEMANNATDIYQDAYNARYEASKTPITKGSNPKLVYDLRAVLDRLKPAYNKAKDDSEKLAEIGDLNRSRMVADQYIQENFLPAIESLVAMNSVGEVLNNRKIIAELDKYASLDKRSASGYTASFLSTLHNGEYDTQKTSDIEVTDAIKNIYRLAGRDDVRATIACAKRIKDAIDSGKNIASEEDYEFIQKVALR